MKSVFFAAVLTGFAALHTANAVQITAQVGGGAFQGDGIRYLNFNEGELGDDGVDVLLQGDASAATWFGNYYAPPSISGDNSVGFGPAPSHPEHGWTETRFLQTSHAKFPEPDGSRITFDFKESQTYFGLLWGSMDPFNNIAFYLAGQEVLIRNGSQIVWDANGSQLKTGTHYVNFTGFEFDEVVLWSDDYSFEIDNVAYGQVTPPSQVPDGGMTVALLGLSMTGLALARRKLQG